MRIITSPYMVENQVFPRTGKERLFTWPWKPWVKTKDVPVPSNEVILDGTRGMVVMHPQLAEKLKAHTQLNEKKGLNDYAIFTNC